MHLVSCGHFRSHDKDGGHTNQSAIAENPTGKPHGSIFYRKKVMGDKSFTLWE